MSSDKNLEIFFENCANLHYKKEYDLSNSSSFRIGGKADYALFPKSEMALCAAVDYLEDYGCKYRVIGNASNVLFSDKGYDGVIIFTDSLKRIRKSGNTLYAECGVPVTALSLYAMKSGLSGLEFAYGIPGTVGGAVYMNAGAYGGEIKNVLLKSTYFDVVKDKKCELYNAGHKFGYRKSVYNTNSNVILSAVFELKNGDVQQIKEKMDGFMAARKEKQPLDYPSAGSVFKRCPGRYTAQMIEEAGLKGYRIGDAVVSEKHAGFIINAGKATSEDVLKLIEKIKETLKQKFDVEIEEEIKYID